MKRKTAPFSQIGNDILFSRSLTIYQKMVYCILVAFSNGKDKTCFPAYSTIAEAAGCSKSTVVKAIAALEQLGYIKKKNQITKKREFSSNLYILVNPIPDDGEILADLDVESVVDGDLHSGEVALDGVASGEVALDGMVLEGVTSGEVGFEFGTPYVFGEIPDVSGGTPIAAGGQELDLTNQIKDNHSFLSRSSPLSPPASVLEGGGDGEGIDLKRCKTNKKGRQVGGSYVGVNADKAQESVFKEQVDYRYFEENFPDKLSLLALCIDMLEELSRSSHYSQYAGQADCCFMIAFLNHIATLDYSKVRFLDRYLKKVFTGFLQNYFITLSTLGELR